MNYKRHARHTRRRMRAKERRSALKGWTYGGAIAREVIQRRIFKQEKHQILFNGIA